MSTNESPNSNCHNLLICSNEILLLIFDEITDPKTILNLACCCSRLCDIALSLIWHTLKFDCSGLRLSGKFSRFVSRFPTFISDQQTRLSCSEHQCVHSIADENLYPNVRRSNHKSHFKRSLQLLSVVYRNKSRSFRYVSVIRITICYRIAGLLNHDPLRKLIIQDGKLFNGGNLNLRSHKYCWLPGLFQELLSDNMLRSQVQLLIFSSPSNFLPYLHGKKITSHLLKTFTKPMRLYLKCEIAAELLEVVRQGYAPFVYSLHVTAYPLHITAITEALKAMKNIHFFSIKFFPETQGPANQQFDELVHRSILRQVNLHSKVIQEVKDLFEVVKSFRKLTTLSINDYTSLSLINQSGLELASTNIDTLFIHNLDPTPAGNDIGLSMFDNISKLSIRFASYSPLFPSSFRSWFSPQFRNLTRLDVQFSDFDVNIDPSCICSLIEMNKGLEWVGMEICNDKILNALASNCPFLVTLSIGTQMPLAYWHGPNPDERNRITSEGLIALSQYCLNLSFIVIYFHSCDVSLFSLLKLAGSLPKLEHLAFRQHEIKAKIAQISESLRPSIIPHTFEFLNNFIYNVSEDDQDTTHLESLLSPCFKDNINTYGLLFNLISHEDDVLYYMYNNLASQSSPLFKVNIPRARQALQQMNKK